MRVFCSEESGATLIEYGIALIVAIIVGGSGLASLADNSSTNMELACGAIADNPSGAAYTCP